MSTKKLNLGIAGLGRGFSVMLPALTLNPMINILAATDLRRSALDRFEHDFDGKAYTSLQSMCSDDRLDAIYIATPHQFHIDHVTLAAGMGKHILVEKPMAITIDECTAMIKAARNAGVYLVVGHSHSFDTPIKKTQQIIEAETLGKLKMITALNYTDFLYRPRRPEEFVTAMGGGVVFSQGSHQVDIVRLLAGGRGESVYAAIGDWDENRPADGAYTALIKFADGVFANISYNGYGRFDTDQFTGWISESGIAKDPDNYGVARRSLEKINNDNAEILLKDSRAYGGESSVSIPTSNYMKNRYYEHFGSLIVSCTRGDINPLPDRIDLYGDQKKTEILKPPTFPRAEVFEELYDAVFKGIEPLHNGEWGRANLEICLAIIKSAENGKEIKLKYQVPAKG